MFGSFCDDVLSIIKRWVPKKKYSKEAGYRDDLIEFIRRELKRGNGISYLGHQEHTSLKRNQEGILRILGLTKILEWN